MPTAWRRWAAASTCARRRSTTWARRVTTSNSTSACAARTSATARCVSPPRCFAANGCWCRVNWSTLLPTPSRSKPGRCRHPCGHCCRPTRPARLCSNCARGSGPRWVPTRAAFARQCSSTSKASTPSGWSMLPTTLRCTPSPTTAWACRWQAVVCCSVNSGWRRFGRTATLPTVRGAKLGAAVLRGLMDQARQRGDTAVMPQAQTAAVGVYEHHGFEREGEVFEAAGVPHQTMRRALWRRCRRFRTAGPAARKPRRGVTGSRRPQTLRPPRSRWRLAAPASRRRAARCTFP